MKFALPLLAALFVVGCSQPAPKVKDPKAEPKTDSAATSGTSGTEEAAKPEPKLSDLPADLKTVGFRYYGLGVAVSPVFEVSGSPQGYATGGYEMKLVSLENGAATFRQTWTGGLSSTLPQSEYVAKKEGVFAAKIGDRVLDKPQMELPATPNPGMSWSTDSRVEIENATIKSSRVKVVGIQKVKTKLGTFDALVVRGEITGEQSGKPLSMGMTEYFVKDVGPVKIVIASKGADGKPVETTLEAIKKQ